MDKICIELPKSLNQSEIEKILAVLNEKKAHEIDILLHHDLVIKDFGTVPILLLFFYTWLRQNTGCVIIDIDSQDIVKVKKFAENYVGYFILLSAWKHRSIFDLNNVEIKQVFRPFTQSFHQKIAFLQNLPNESVGIPLFDHYSKEQGLSQWFYESDYRFVNSPSALSNTIYRIFQEVGKIYTGRIEKNVQSILDDLEVIIWELMGNTHHHARKDFLNQSDLSPNLRGLYLKIHRSSKDNFLNSSKENKGLTNYYNSVLKPGNNFILEISIFDSGPGLVKRYLGNDWNEAVAINEEVRIVKKCLLKGTSSAVGASGKARGLGLNNVLSTLGKKSGFLTIRSGRASLYRDLHADPHIETDNEHDILLNDALTTNKQSYTLMTSIVGTSFTMVYPLID